MAFDTETIMREIAARIPGWKVIEVPGKEFEKHELIDDTGRRIHIHNHTSSYSSAADRGKIGISGSWPSYRNERGQIEWMSPYQGGIKQDTSIHVTATRGWDAIAREIKNRFLPAYNNVYVQLQARADSMVRYTDGKLATFSLICAELGEPNKLNHASQPTIHLGSQLIGKGYATVSVNSVDSVDIDLKGMPAEAAIEILRLLKRMRTQSELPSLSDIELADEPSLSDREILLEGGIEFEEVEANG